MKQDKHGNFYIYKKLENLSVQFMAINYINMHIISWKGERNERQ